MSLKPTHKLTKSASMTAIDQSDDQSDAGLKASQKAFSTGNTGKWLDKSLKDAKTEQQELITAVNKAYKLSRAREQALGEKLEDVAPMIKREGFLEGYGCSLTSVKKVADVFAEMAGKLRSDALDVAIDVFEADKEAAVRAFSAGAKVELKGLEKGIKQMEEGVKKMVVNENEKK
ncbi:hypothetical protein B0A48_08344 [Cryoendolithus antarcticus]|uniref:Uncharacterized protein n=1 Tax=Cryoendolithus antarcticus TaxID=1507870 RepID=A0A1V8T5M9_9PEZI|nr:hypothetical protein B0A48_08344 [Cryoendolithus antarcticus]